MTKAPLACLLLTSILASVVVGQNETPRTDTAKNSSPAEIIERYIQSCGGPSVAQVKTEKRTGTLMRGATGKAPLVSYAGEGGRWRYDQTFAWGDRISFGSDGTIGWKVDADSSSEMPEPQWRELQLIFDVQAPLKLKELYPEMVPAGTDSVGGKEALVLRATARDGTTTELAFDRASGLLVRAGQIWFEDYRPVGAVVRPHRVLLGETVGEAHRQMVMVFSQIVDGETIDDTLLAHPVCVMTPQDPPLYARRLEVEVPSEALDACVGVYQDPADSGITWEAARQGSHLMIMRSDRPAWYEIKPSSETDYFIRFLNAEFHFVKDSTGTVTSLEFGRSRTKKALRIK